MKSIAGGTVSNVIHSCRFNESFNCLHRSHTDSDGSIAPCFSYAYDGSKKSCTGYVFQFFDDENHLRLCGANLGGDLSVANTTKSRSKSAREASSDASFEDDDIVDTYIINDYDFGDDEHNDDAEETKRRSGCVLVMRALGVVVSTKKCKERCAQRKDLTLLTLSDHTLE